MLVFAKVGTNFVRPYTDAARVCEGDYAVYKPTRHKDLNPNRNFAPR